MVAVGLELKVGVQSALRLERAEEQIQAHIHASSAPKRCEVAPHMLPLLAAECLCSAV